MMRFRTVVVAVLLVGVVAVSAACATSSRESGTESVAQGFDFPECHATR